MRILAAATQGHAQPALAASPFRTQARQIRRCFGATLRTEGGIPLSGLGSALRDADVAFVMVSWSEKPDRVVEALAAAHAAPNRPRLVFVDWYDQTSSPFLGVLPYVDLYAKRQVLADVAWYQEPMEGGYAFTDFLDRELGFPLEGWNFGTAAEGTHLHKIVPGWNFGAGASFANLLRLGSLMGRRWSRRDVDVQARFEPARGESHWYAWYRRGAGELLTPLRDEFTVTAAGRVPRGAYLRELRRTKLVFSPFGWGEVCFRDFEAACFGCVLIKPAMSHLVTSPDIYVPYETYIPVRWDLADLERTIRTYLARPEECRRIAANARVRFRDYVRAGGVMSDLERVMDALEHPPAPRAEAEAQPMPWRIPHPAAEQGLARFAPVSLQTQ